MSRILYLSLLLSPSIVLARNGTLTTSKMDERTPLDLLKEFWMFRLFLNVFGYATVILPGFLLLRWLKTSGYLEKSGMHSF